VADFDLTGVELKIKRARRHFADLKAELERILDPSGYRFTFERAPDGLGHLYRIRGVPVLDDEWRLVVGEILYNLRSALDHLAWQLVVADGGTPGELTKFPIRKSPGKSPLQLQPPIINSPQVLEALESVQPYWGPSGEPCDYRLSHLWQLSRLNNIDKHRLLLVLPCVVALDEMWFGWDDTPPPDIVPNYAPLKEGDPIASFDFHGKDPPEGFDPHPAVRIALYEPEVTRVAAFPVENILDSFCWCVEERILGWVFRPVLSGEARLL